MPQVQSGHADLTIDVPRGVAVNVTAGQHVSAGDVLAVMTAMKMEMALATPFDGVVQHIGCGVGDLVGTRQILVSVIADGARG